MREKPEMDGASEELERRSRYLSSLIERTKIKAAGAAAEEGSKKEKEKEKQRGKGDEDREEQPANVRVRAADMPPALQRRAFRCAREALDGMPKLDSKRLALALKKLKLKAAGVGYTQRQHTNTLSMENY